jgi:hypothetical protein
MKGLLMPNDLGEQGWALASRVLENAAFAVMTITADLNDGSTDGPFPVQSGGTANHAITVNRCGLHHITATEGDDEGDDGIVGKIDFANSLTGLEQYSLLLKLDRLE